MIVRKRATSTQNSYGENNADFTSKDFVTWCAIDDTGNMSGRKLLAAQQILSEGDHLVRMRYRTGLNAAKQFETVVGARKFDVKSVANIDERDREIWFRCVETNPAP